MKKWLAIALLYALVLVSATSVVYSTSFEHMASQNGCVFTFGGSSQCITDIVGSILLTQNSIPVAFAFISVLLFSFVVASLSLLLFHPDLLSRYHFLESFLSPYPQQLTRWLSLREHSPSLL